MGKINSIKLPTNYDSPDEFETNKVYIVICNREISLLFVGAKECICITNDRDIYSHSRHFYKEYYKILEEVTDKVNITLEAKE